MAGELSIEMRSAPIRSGSTRRCRRSVDGSGAGALRAVLLVAGFALGLAGCQVPAASHVPIASKAGPKIKQISPDNAAVLVPEKTPVRLTGDPQELMGLDTASIADALGTPGQIRKEAPAQVWQYLAGDCVLDLYLYDDGGVSRVTYLEARSPKAEPAPAERCVKSVLQHPTAMAD